MNDLIPASGVSKGAFWSRTEGTTGMITLGLIGLGSFFAFQALAPIVLSLLGTAIAIVGKGIVLSAMCVFLAAFLFIVTNKKFLLLGNIMFKTAMRKLTNAFVTIFPIEIMEEYVDTMKEKKVIIDENKTNVRGQMRICEERLKTNTKKVDNALTEAKVAMDQGKKNVFQLNANVAGRLEKSNMSTQELLTRMVYLYKTLTKFSEAADFVIQDLTSEIEVRKEEREMTLGAYSAMMAAQDIINGSGDKKELYDNALEFVVEDYGRKMGEIDDFMNSSQDFIDGLDMQNGVFAENALKQLEAWENKADSILLGTEKRTMIENMQTNSVSLMSMSQPATIDADYTKFFDRK